MSQVIAVLAGDGSADVGRRKAEERAFRYDSAEGWWIASYLERFEWYDEDRRNPNRRCLAWENTVLIKAADREEAYRKVLTLGRLANGSEMWNDSGRKGAWVFEGVTSLLPVQEPLEDGAEILWAVHSGKSVKRIKARAKQKNDLEAFADRRRRGAGPQRPKKAEKGRRTRRVAG